MDSDVLKDYTPATYPTIAGGEPRFITDELQKLQRAIALLTQVVKEIDARCVAGGI